MSRTFLDLNQDMPTCGFKGELCDQTGTVIIIAAVMTAVFVSVGIFVAVRRM
uniref:TMhelix containing protein n=1 Tax=Heterorhabditis bacteriophora TaxID=37862 RepID=A0A1I7WDV4_HETBA